MLKKIKQIYLVLKDAVSNAMEHEVITFAAAIAFYTIFSLPGLLIITITISSIFFGTEAVTGELSNQIRGFIGNQGAESIEKILVNVEFTGGGNTETIVAIGVLLFTATTVFITLQDALNRIWKVDKLPRKAWIKFIIDRVLSMGMVVSLGFLLLISLILETILNIFMGKIERVVGSFSATIIDVVSFTFSSIIIVILIALIFKVLPDKKIRWKDVWLGSVITAVFFIIGKLFIGIYIENSDFSETYEAAGSLIVVLVWVYYSTLIVLFGAEITQSIMKHKNSNEKIEQQ